MSIANFEFVKDGAKIIVIFIPLVYFLIKGRSFIARKKGLAFLILGFLIMLLGGIMDFTDEFAALDGVYVIGAAFPHHEAAEDLLGITGFVMFALGIAMEINSARKENIERKKMIQTLQGQAEELKKLDKMKSEFVSMASHELRTPLTAIKESVAIVTDGSTGALNTEQGEFLKLAKRNIDRLARLINNVLDFQKLESKKMEFRMEKGDINKLVEEAVKGMSHLIKNKKLDLAVSLSREIPRITFDRDKITQVLVNLINNAVKVTEKGGITVSSSTEVDNREWANISVSDTGIGIKEEDVDKLFKGFSQISAERGRVAGGTGLGLAISKKIIEEHGGRMICRSEYGKGSTFSFLLPVKESEG
ncbi:sensor histidine kinase [Candidatus Omnitrophota bacterium]